MMTKEKSLTNHIMRKSKTEMIMWNNQLPNHGQHKLSNSEMQVHHHQLECHALQITCLNHLSVTLWPDLHLPFRNKLQDKLLFQKTHHGKKEMNSGQSEV